MGQLANEVRAALESAIEEQGKRLEAKALEARLEAEAVDVTIPGQAPTLGHKHPLYLAMDELKDACTNLYVMTDDGSNGHKGFVTTALEEQLKAGVQYDEIIAIGPLPMMRGVCNMTKEYDIPTIVSMNPIMIDGTGMCGGCRLTVGGETRFACVDGPDFDGHLVDFDEAISRSKMYKAEEAASMERHADCNLMKKGETANA